MAKKQGSVQLGDKLHRVTVRFNDRQFDYLTLMSDVLDVSISEFLRMSVNAMIYADKNTPKATELKNVVKTTEKESEVAGRENDKTNIHDKL